MSLDDALFLVNRGGTKHKVSGANIGIKIKNNDSVLVQRGTNKFKATYNNGFSKIQDTDLVLAYKGGSNYQVSGANFQALLRSISINPASLQDTKDNILGGGRMNPRLVMANSELLESKGRRLSCTWKLRGMTKGDEEASFEPNRLVDEYYDRDNKSPPTVHRTSKTKNNHIELYAEGLNTHNSERACVSHYFTCQMQA